MVSSSAHSSGIAPPLASEGVNNFISMDRNWLYSPVKYSHQTLNTSAELIQLNEFLHIQGSTNTVSQKCSHRRLFTTHGKYKQRSQQLELVLRDLYIRKLGLAFQILRRRTLRTLITQPSQSSSNNNLQSIEAGLAQLHYVIKSQQQKDKVMAFTFVKNLYKRRRVVQRTLVSLGRFLTKRRKTQKESALKCITQYALTRTSLSQYKFALKFLEKIILNKQSNRKKQAFQAILRRALGRMKTQPPPRIEVPQHIFVVNQRHHSRQRFQTVHVTIPVLSQKIYLQELNIRTRRKHRRSGSAVKEQAKGFSCIHSSVSRQCKYCDILRSLNY